LKFVINHRDTLVAALRERGVDYLVPSDAVGEPVSDGTLIASLAAQEDARLRSALAALFLLHPELADGLPAILEPLEPLAQSELQARYMAAVYLQRFWRTRLEIYNLTAPDLPDLFSAQLGLPGADEGFGKPGLAALAEWHQRQRPVSYNRRVEYELVIEHLIASLKMHARQNEPAPVG
jgi:hypothetical protein